jgi:hypothetical protein
MLTIAISNHTNNAVMRTAQPAMIATSHTLLDASPSQVLVKERNVMMEFLAQKTHVTRTLETASTMQTTMRAMTTTNAPSTDATARKDAPTPLSFATTEMLAPSTTVTNKQESVHTSQESALQKTNAQLLPVIARRDASMKRRTAMTTSLALTIAATQQLDVRTSQTKSFATTTMLAPSTFAI